MLARTPDDGRGNGRNVRMLTAMHINMLEVAQAALVAIVFVATWLVRR